MTKEKKRDIVEQQIDWKKIGPTEWHKFKSNMDKVIQNGNNGLATATTFGSLPNILKSEGGVLAKNGKLYGSPFSATKILEINSVEKTIRNFGNVSEKLCKWEGGTLAHNGKIYSFPFNANSVLEIDTDDEIIAELRIPAICQIQSISQILFNIL